jgi:hypothetical protein
MWKPRRKRRNPKPSMFPWTLTCRITDYMDFFLRVAARKQLLLRSELIREILKDALLSGKYATQLDLLKYQ